MPDRIVLPDAGTDAGQEDPPGLVPLADALRLAAYESLSPRERSWIKATLALVECVYGQLPTATDSRTVRAEYGLIARARVRPAAWTLCVPGFGFASASRFAAAIMCARLAGVENLLAVWPTADASACSAALLTVLELAGVERAYTLAAPASPAFWHELADSLDAPRSAESAGSAGSSGGRLLYFGARDGLHAVLTDMAARRGLPWWADRTPRVGVDASVPGAPGELDNDAIRFAHPDAVSIGPADDACTVLFTARQHDAFAGPGRPDLVLGPGLEGCWLHPDLPPDFFLTRRTAVFPCRESDSPGPSGRC